MKTLRVLLPLVAACALAADLSASGRLGIYGIIERVVFEPNDAAPERVQVWGVFAYVDARVSDNAATSRPRRGFLYFTLPLDASSTSEIALVRREWADLKAVAGTGQAVGFGHWGYIGRFGTLSPDTTGQTPPYVLERVGMGNQQADLRVRPAGERPTNPAAYQTNAGVVTLTDSGSHADTVRQLRDALTP